VVPGIVIVVKKFSFLWNQGEVSALDELNRLISAPTAGTLEAPYKGRFFFVRSSSCTKKLPADGSRRGRVLHSEEMIHAGPLS
jgi:hypothetical protein